jgi:esterase/lipase superfamily enzyme
MFLRWLIAAVFFAATASCGPRGGITVAPQARAIGTIEPIFIGTMRGRDPETGEEFGRHRVREIRFARVDVSVPPKRKPGEIKWPRRGRIPDPATDFLAADQLIFASETAFRDDLRAALAQRGGPREAVIFVHGFNTTFAEGTYRFAQLGHDLKVDAALVHFSWPSRGSPLAYVYDRDSVHYARDGLEKLIGEVEAAGARRVLIVGHSMGSFLVMETLRQIAIGKRHDLLGKIRGVVLMSPDIDVDVFHEQTWRIRKLPQPFLIFTSKKDKALGLSARLTGERDRLGNLADPREVADLDVTLVDTTAFSVGGGHFNVGNSPALIAILGNIGDVDAAFAAEASGKTGLLGGVVLTVQDATQIVMSPVTALAGQ